MSSILEALKKVEREKAARANAARQQIDRQGAEEDLFGKKSGEGMTLRLTPLMMGLGIGTLLIFLVATSIGVSLLVARRAVSVQIPDSALATPSVLVQEKSPDDATALAARAGTPETPAPQSSETRPLSAQPAPEPAAAESPAPAELAALPLQAAGAQQAAVAPAPPAPPEPAPQPEMPAPQPVTPGSVPPPERPADINPVQQPDPPANSGNEGLGAGDLPLLTESARQSLGLPKIQINILGPPTPRRPYPSVYINRKLLTVGDYIPETNARIIAIDHENLHGVAIEIDGKRYFLMK